MSQEFTAPELCEVVGITYRQIDYWVRTGLVRPSLGHRGTTRRFSAEDLEDVQSIRVLLDGGVSLQVIRQILAYKRGETTSRPKSLSDWMARQRDVVEVLRSAGLLSDGGTCGH